MRSIVAIAASVVPPNERVRLRTLARGADGVPSWDTTRVRGRCEWLTYIWSRVSNQEIIAAIDAEILCLQQVRNLISDLGGTKRGNRPPAGSALKAKRTLSAEAREKIAAAQRKRWAKQEKVTVTKLPPKHAPVKRPRTPVALKTKTALTGRVPSGPVAAPAPKS